MPGLPGPAVHSARRAASNTSLAAITPIRWPLISVISGAYASVSSLPIPRIGKPVDALIAERVLETDQPVVHPVVVGHGHGVDPGRLQRVDGLRRNLEREGLGLGAARRPERGLEVHHREVGGRHGRGDRRQQARAGRTSTGRTRPSKLASPPKANVTGCPLPVGAARPSWRSWYSPIRPPSRSTPGCSRWDSTTLPRCRRAFVPAHAATSARTATVTSDAPRGAPAPATAGSTVVRERRHRQRVQSGLGPQESLRANGVGSDPPGAAKVVRPSSAYGAPANGRRDTRPPAAGPPMSLPPAPSLSDVCNG